MIKIELTQKTAKLFCSRNGARPAMNHVYYDATEKALVMADGHILAVVSLPDADEPESFVMPFEALPMNGEHCIVTKDGKNIFVERFGKKTKSTSTFEVFPEPYPNWRSVMPDKAKAMGMAPGEVSGWNFDFLGKFGALAKELTNVPLCNIVFNGPLQAASVYGEGFYGLIMPVRV